MSDRVSVQLRHKLPSAEVAKLMGNTPKRSDFGMLVTGNVNVYKPNGDPLLMLFKGGISEENATAAYPYIHWLGKFVTHNRGQYSGKAKIQRVKKTGELAPSVESAVTHSIATGFLDGFSARFVACRATSFVTDNPEGWGSAQPVFREVADTFRKHLPDRYAKQEEMAKKTHPAYVVPGTPFTTVSANNCETGGYHLDKADYPPGFGCMTVYRRGSYKGAELVYPAFGVAVDMEDRDLILFDVHEVHGNVPFEDCVGERYTEWERISMVYYFRMNMVNCLAPDEEIERAKERAETATAKKTTA